MSDAVPRVLLGVTGGIAAYKSAVLVRELVRAGARVDCVLTESALRFVGAATFQALSGRPVTTDLWDPRFAAGMGHIDLVRDCDIVVVAPATADFVAKLAHGRADDLLSTLCLARECPLAVAPAMNRQMWQHPATQRNAATLRADGVVLLGPDNGEQACGEVGDGRMIEPELLAEAVLALLRPKRLRGWRVLLTSGPTFERIDAVRGITNRSSGRMGHAIARAAIEAGADVTLVSGPVATSPPFGARVIRVESAAEMLAAVEAALGQTDIFVSVAAVADYTPLEVHAHKLKKKAEVMNLELGPTVDILANVAGRANPPFCVGFAAESERLEEHAEAKRRRKHVPLLVANLAQDAIGADDSALVLLSDAGREALERAPKLVQARRLVERIAAMVGPAPRHAAERI
jgi:phosphopantothenoylcysteine decarboxylase/phosphopantothenate--cysteine ligase